MKIHHDIHNFSVKNPVITLGAFDGVHLGHQKVIDHVNQIAERANGESTIYTFYPHPRLVVNPSDASLRLLTTIDEKVELLKDTGIKHLVIYPFTLGFAKLSYQEFIENILIEKMGMHTLVVGYDHKLGRNREGDFNAISTMAEEYNFQLEKIDPYMDSQINVSSTKIRNALQSGDVAKAQKYLGYFYSLTGVVTEGNRIGRSIGFPTANLVASDPNKLIPALGVYAVKVYVDGEEFNGMLNIGYRPTVTKNADLRTIEVHIIDFNADIYNKEITLKFINRIRDEKKFESVDQLKIQLNNDKLNIQNYFRVSGF